MKTLPVILTCLLSVPGLVWAEGNSIRGIVTDAKGKPVPGAEIRADRTDSKGPAAVATTDAKGQYVLNHLAVGTYKVVASFHKTPQSAASVKTNTAGWVKVDFALKSSFVGAQGHDSAATDRVQGQDIRQMQMNQGFGSGVGMPGR